MGPTFNNPPALGPPRGPYSQVARAGGLVLVAGQAGVAADGSLVGPDIGSQTRQAYANLASALASEGLTFGDVVKLTTFIVGEQHLAEFVAVRNEVFGHLFPSGRFPVSTLAVVSRLASEAYLVEVEAVAYRSPGRTEGGEP
jgi:enamine deaminase RidA (YjgF/YER057c/UK114 family)